MSDKPIHLFLDDEKREELERLSALGYTVKEMALYFDIDFPAFKAAAEDPTSNIYYHVQRGQLMSVAKEQMALLESAEKGNVTASQQLDKIRKSRGWNLSKKDIFGGFDDKKRLQKLQDYIQSGTSVDISAEEQIYLEALTLINSMDRKYGRRNTVEFFTKPPFNLKHARAREMYDEAMSLFYTDRNIEKKALRHKFAEQLDEAALFVFKNAQSAKDMEVYGDLKMKAAKLFELDRPDKDKLPAQIFMRPLRLFSLDPTQVGIPEINRHQVASLIDALEVPERDKIRLRQDAMLENINFDDRLDELEKEGKA